MNICVVCCAMKGGWHSNALIHTEVRANLLVARSAEAKQALARPYRCAKWGTHLAEALANPCEQPAAIEIPSLAHGNHSLVETPLALSLADSENTAAVARQRDLTLGLVHPLRLSPGLIALRELLRAGHEHVRHAGGRFCIH